MGRRSGSEKTVPPSAKKYVCAGGEIRSPLPERKADTKEGDWKFLLPLLFLVVCGRMEEEEEAGAVSQREGGSERCIT